MIWVRFQLPGLRELAADGANGLTVAKIANLAKGMDNVYLEFFGRLLDDLGGNLELYQDLVATVLAPREPIPKALWERAVNLSPDARSAVSSLLSGRGAAQRQRGRQDRRTSPCPIGSKMWPRPASTRWRYSLAPPRYARRHVR